MSRINGPYSQPNGTWRVVVAGRGRGGARRDFIYATEAEATAKAKELRALSGLKTVEQALEQWWGWLKSSEGYKDSTIQVYKDRLVGRKAGGLLRPVLEDAITSIKPPRAQKLYDAYQEGRAPDTHQGALNEAKAFFEWARKKEKLVSANPFVDVDPVGKKRKRKFQHRIDEAAKLYKHLVQQADHDDGALGVLIALVLGFRAYEVVGITRRDIDAGGTVLWAAGDGDGKTEGATAPVVLPEELRAPLMKRAELRSGRLLPYRPPWVRENTIKACRAAGVPTVCAQALRGMHATVGLEAGTSPEAVAKTLRHGVSMTKGAYAAKGAGRTARAEAMLDRLKDL